MIDSPPRHRKGKTRHTVSMPNRKSDTLLYDVIAVSLSSGARRVMDTRMDAANAEAFIDMAIARRGLDEEFYEAVPHDPKRTA